MKFRAMQWLVVLGVVLGACPWGSAQTVEFWMEENNAPYSRLKDNDELEGLWVDIANEMIKETNLQVRWRVAPWKRIITRVGQTQNAVVFGILREPEREKAFIFIGPMTVRRIFLFKMKERSDIKIRILDDAKAFTVGGLRGANHTEVLNAHGIETDDVASSPLNIKKLSAGRIDLAVMEEYTFAGGVRQTGLDKNDFEKAFLIDTKHYYIAVHKDADRVIVETLQQRVKQINDNGALQRIKAFYLHSKISTP